MVSQAFYGAFSPISEFFISVAEPVQGFFSARSVNLGCAYGVLYWPYLPSSGIRTSRSSRREVRVFVSSLWHRIIGVHRRCSPWRSAFLSSRRRGTHATSSGRRGRRQPRRTSRASPASRGPIGRCPGRTPTPNEALDTMRANPSVQGTVALLRRSNPIRESVMVQPSCISLLFSGL